MSGISSPRFDNGEELVSANKKEISPKEQQELVQLFTECYDHSRKQRFHHERQWYINLAFYFGRQWVQWVHGKSETVLNRLYEPPAPPWRVRLTVNRIRRICRTEMSKLNKQHPRAFVIPATSDEDDLAAAKAGEAIYEHTYRTLEMNKVLRRATFWQVVCGNGFIKDWWDKTAPTDDSELTGNIAATHVTPFHLLFPELQEEEIERQPYGLHVIAMNPAHVKDLYGQDIAPDSYSGGEVLEQKFLTAVGISDKLNKDYVAVKEIWYKPCAKFPQGAMAAFAGDSLLYFHEGWPYQHGEYPFTKLDSIPTGKFYSDSIVTDLIPIQKEFNRTRSQIIEAKNRMAKPQLIAQKGSIDTNRITTEPGLIIEYRPGYQPPTALPLTPLPAYVSEDLQRCIADMDDLASQHEVTRGQTPPGVEAATAISFLSEQDDLVLFYSLSSVEEGVERLGRHFLSHADQYWQSERAVRILGMNNTWETYMFSAANLRGNNDLKVEAGSALPTSRAAKQAFITELMDKGWIPPEKGLRYLDMAETGKLYEEMSIDFRQQQRENLKMSQGIDVPVNEWDNHELHVIEIETFMKKQEFENLPPEIQQLFHFHRMLHLQKLAMARGVPRPFPGEQPPPDPNMAGGAPPSKMPPQAQLPFGPGGPPGGNSGPPPGPPGPPVG